MFAHFLIGSPQQRQADNSGLTSVQPGPPVPFVVLSYIPGNSDGSVPQFEGNEEIDQFPVNVAIHNFSSLNDVQQPDNNATSTPSSSTVANPSYEHKPAILNSDIDSHWNNLQYGRFFQDARPRILYYTLLSCLQGPCRGMFHRMDLEDHLHRIQMVLVLQTHRT